MECYQLRQMALNIVHFDLKFSNALVRPFKKIKNENFSNVLHFLLDSPIKDNTYRTIIISIFILSQVISYLVIGQITSLGNPIKSNLL